MHVEAKAQIKMCYEKNKIGDPNFQSLTTSMKARLRQTVGESYWKKAHDYLDHFLKQKMQSKEEKQKQRSSSGGSDQHPSSSSHRSQSSGNRQPQMPPSQQQQQQQHMMRMQSNNMPPAVGNNITLPDGRILTTEQKEAMDKKKAEDEEAEKKKKRNAQARKKRAEQKKLKEKDKKSKTAVVSTGGGIAHTVTSVNSPSSTNSGTVSSTGMASKASTKAKKTVKRSSSSSSITKRKTSAREPPHRYMETIDHATLIDVKSFPSLFNSKDYKNEGGVNLEEEQRILLYGDANQQAKVKNITDAASKALDTAVDVETRESKFREVGVKPLPIQIPSVYDGWGKKNVLSVRNAWAKIRLPESDMQREESAMSSETTKSLIADPAQSSSTSAAAPVPSSSSSVSGPSIQTDTTNHVWFNEARAEQDPTLALISEATELFLKGTIENAIGKARLRQNLDGVRLWNTIQAHSAITDLDHDTSPPPAYIRLGCDVRRQVALSEGNAAKVYQRMEEAITRQNDTYHPNDSSTDPHEMLLQSTSMGDLSRKPPLKMAAQVADAVAKRKFAVFVGSESMDPALGRVPTQATVTLQDLVVGDAGNRASMIGTRRKRFRVGLKY
jgi:hypothetical protein